MAFVSAYSLICQNILIEKDDVQSAIRIVEIFFIPKDIPAPAAVGMSLFVHVRLSNDDNAPHSLHFDLIRPNGDRTSNLIFENLVIQPPKFGDGDRTIAAVGQVGVDPKQIGIHSFAIMLDGVEVCDAKFILLHAPEKVAEEQTEKENPLN